MTCFFMILHPVTGAIQDWFENTFKIGKQNEKC